MNRTRRPVTIHRLARALAAFAAALLATTAAAPAALAQPVPPASDGTGRPPPVHTVIIGGTPGWQIALIAIAAAAVAAATAVLLDRARATRRHQPAPNA